MSSARHGETYCNSTPLQYERDARNAKHNQGLQKTIDEMSKRPRNKDKDIGNRLSTSKPIQILADRTRRALIRNVLFVDQTNILKEIVPNKGALIIPNTTICHPTLEKLA
ncbi:hypothetical protein DPMN_100324 [Dreissena polymorpha]|uniref:Uncharacterized protein n=1 Tax=Dreissena polymorpha TaxID=45954 RepID=A0A9D4LI15_DREPO|nr:hypothetical protein DPMN_100324 [Dreissena polymorpha]